MSEPYKDKVDEERLATLPPPPPLPRDIRQDFETTIQVLLPRTDNVDTPSFTFRVLVLGTLFCSLLAYTSQVMKFRTSAFSMSAYATVLLAYPLGQLMARTLPTHKFHLPLVGKCSLNPGAFSVKETVLIYIMGSTGTSGVMGTENLFVQKFYYGVDIGTAASLGFLLATMMAGFGIAGICHRFLVRPAHMIWPSVLPQITLIQSFHKDAEDNTDQGSSRLRFFAVAVVAVVVYQFVPGFLAPSLSSIGIICLLTSNPIAQHIGSPNKGVGVLSFSLDWSIIGALGNPLTVPFWVQCNVFMSWIIFAWVLTPLAWRGRWFGGPTLGIVLNTSELVNKTGDVVGARQLVDPVTKDLLLDVYNAQAPFYMSPFFAFTHCAAFAAFPAAISQALVWHGRDLFRRFRSARLQEDEDDIHCQLIDRYPAVPWTWYALFFVVPAALGIVVCHTSGIDMPWYLSLLSLAVSVCGSIPYGILYAVTGIQLSLKVMSEFLIGVISPGHPILVMAFRTLAVTVALAVTKLLEDLKVGHYMKVPPRHVFLAQMYAQVLAVLVAYATLDGWTRDPQHVDWVVHPERYTHDPIAAQWKSSGAFFMAYNISLIWGAIGPVRFFITSYLPLVCIGFAIGGLIPVLCKLGDMYFPTRFPWRLVSAPLLLCLYGPGISTAIPMTSILITFASQYWAFRYRRAWWKRYNYVLATALDIGAVVSTILIVYTIHAHQVRGPTWALDGQSGDFCTQVKTDKALASQ